MLGRTLRRRTPTWFITGASSGLGFAFAHDAFDRGYNIVATARSIGRLEALAAESPARLLTHKLDVTNSLDAEQPSSASAASMCSPTMPVTASSARISDERRLCIHSAGLAGTMVGARPNQPNTARFASSRDK
jgi:NAD(P)-dependent dehydrogenase (short-subunit alcohol dehydrogenase family)